MKRITFLVFFALTAVLSASSQILEERYLFHDDLIREYLIYVPSTYNSEVAAPLVLVMHGFGSNKENMLGVGLNDYAEETGYIVVYPDGVVGLFASAWNNGMVLNLTIDDMGFLNGLMDTVINTYNINERRIYSTGFSMGGVMSHRLGCESSHRMAAVASMSGPLAMSIRDNCTPEYQVPMLHLHGTADDVLAYSGSGLTGTTGALNTFHTWANHNGCEGEVIVEQVPDTADDVYHVERYSYSDCPERGEVLHYRIYDWPHSWPRSRFNISATKEMVDFFERHERDEEEIVLNLNQNLTDAELISVKPNPFANYLDLSLLGSFNSSLQWKIYNSGGQLMMAGDHMRQINTSDWGIGLYVIRITTDDHVQSIPLIKQ